MTRDQERALRYMRANLGEGTEGGLWFEGLNQPRLTLASLERAGLVRRCEWLDEEWGYRFELTEQVAA